MAIPFDLSQFAFAHRGLWNEAAPENSLSAFRRAAQANFGAECDLHLSADGEVMVFHDFTLERMTGERGRVDETHSHLLKTLALKGTSETIPTFHECLQVMGGLPMLVELKSNKSTDRDALAEAVCRILNAYEGPAAVMSFDHVLVKILRRFQPSIMTGLLTEPLCFHDETKRDQALSFASEHKLDFIAPSIMDAEMLAASQSSFAKSFPSWTVSTPEHLNIARNANASPIFEKLASPLVRPVAAS